MRPSVRGPEMRLGRKGRQDLVRDKVTVSVLRQEGTVAHPQPFVSHSGSGEGGAQFTAIGER